MLCASIKDAPRVVKLIETETEWWWLLGEREKEMWSQCFMARVSALQDRSSGDGWW